MTTSSPVSSVVLKRYAAALLDLAEESKSVAKIQKDLIDLEKSISDSDDLKYTIASPLLSKERQDAVIAEISKKAKLQKLTANFLGVLVENRRLNALPGVIKAFNKMLSEKSGEVAVRVETAEKMTASQEKELTAKLSGALGTKITIQADVVPEILGGMVLTIGSYMVDDSVRRKIERLGACLKSNANQNTVNLKEVV